MLEIIKIRPFCSCSERSDEKLRALFSAVFLVCSACVTSVLHMVELSFCSLLQCFHRPVHRKVIGNRLRLSALVSPAMPGETELIGEQVKVRSSLHTMLHFMLEEN